MMAEVSPASDSEIWRLVLNEENAKPQLLMSEDYVEDWPMYLSDEDSLAYSTDQMVSDWRPNILSV